jgi:hypothetical protein
MNYTLFLKTEFPVLLGKLTEAHQPQWGLMNAQQMVEHLGLVFLISNGKSKYIAENMNLERMAKARISIFEEKQPFPKNIRLKSLPETPSPVRFADLETAKSKLLEEVARFEAYFQENPTSKPLHPAFGELSSDEWCEFHARHILHHFEQFSLVSVPVAK